MHPLVTVKSSEDLQGILNPVIPRIAREHYLLTNLEITARKKWLEAGMGVGLKILYKNPDESNKWHTSPTLFSYLYAAVKVHPYSKIRKVDSYFILGCSLVSLFSPSAGIGVRFYDRILLEMIFRSEILFLYFAGADQYDVRFLLGYSF